MTAVDDMNPDQALLRVRDVHVELGGRRLVEALNLELTPNQSIGVLGPNGAGKTTLLATLAGIRAPSAGVVELNGNEMTGLPRRSIARRLGMLVQNTRFAFDASCLEIALSGRHPHLPRFGGERAEDFQRARDALVAVDLATHAVDSCLELSGGEQRRLALAVVLAQDPAVLLLDEPTNHLDPAHQITILDHLWRRLRRGERGQIIALHDINLCTCYCSHVLMLPGDGRWSFGPVEEMLTEARLSELYGCAIRAVRGADGHQVFALAGGPTTTIC